MTYDRDDGFINRDREKNRRSKERMVERAMESEKERELQGGQLKELALALQAAFFIALTAVGAAAAATTATATATTTTGNSLAFTAQIRLIFSHKRTKLFHSPS